MEPVQVLGQPAVSGLGETEVAFQDQDGCSTLARIDALPDSISRSGTGHRPQDAFTGRDPELHPGQRAKQAGMRWTLTGLDPILTLRTLTRSGRDHHIWGSDASQTTPAPAA